MAIIDSRTVLRVDATASLPALAAGDEGTLAYDQVTDSCQRWTGTAWAPLNTGYLVMGAPAAGDTITAAVATNFASNLSLPAGALAASRALRLTARGVYGTNAVPPNLTLAFKAGTTVLCTTGSQLTTGALTNAGWIVDVMLSCITAGVTGTVEVQGLANLSTSGATAAQWDMENTGTITLDTTAAQTLQMESTWSAAAAGTTITMRQFIISVLGTA